MAGASPLSVTDGQREVLEVLVRSRTAQFRQVQRARVLLLAAEGVSNAEIAGVWGVAADGVGMA